MIGNPVDATTGRKLLLDELDFSLPGLMPIEWSRFYASDLKVDSVLGQGWVLPWEQSLLSYNGFVYLTDNQGLIHYNADKSATVSQDFDGEHYAIQFDEFVNMTDETAKQQRLTPPTTTPSWHPSPRRRTARAPLGTPPRPAR